MARCALVRDNDGLVLNVVEWDGVAPYTPPAGCSVINPATTAQIGGTWNGSTFSPPPAPPPLPDQSAFDAAVAQLKATYNTPRTVAQVNNSIDAITVILRRIVRELS